MKLQKEEFDYLYQLIINDIHEVYDDPYFQFGSKKEVIKWINICKKTLSKFKEFDSWKNAVIEANVTDYEIKRMKKDFGVESV